MEGADPQILAEIQKAVGEAIGRFGLAGHVEVRPGEVALLGHGPPVVVPTGPLFAQWGDLPHDVRTRRATEIARSLSQARREAVEASKRAALGARGSRRRVLTLSLLGGALVLGGFEVRRYLRERAIDKMQQEAADERAVDAYERERVARAARVCEATRSRVMRGAAVGPADVEGWVTELTLLGVQPDATELPAIAPYLGPEERDLSGATHRRFLWSSSPALAKADGPDTFVNVADGSVSGHAAARVPGMRLVLQGRYVIPYFHEKQRGEFVRFASALAKDTGASHGALYARCADHVAHHLGAWFYGPTPAGAMAALLYFMGSFAEVSHLRSSAVTPPGQAAQAEPDRAYVFERLRSVTAPLDKQRALAMLGPHGGMITGQDGQPSAITFPFHDSNRAARASREIARELGIGSDR